MAPPRDGAAPALGVKAAEAAPREEPEPEPRRASRRGSGPRAGEGGAAGGEAGGEPRRKSQRRSAPRAPGGEGAPVTGSGAPGEAAPPPPRRSGAASKGGASSIATLVQAAGRFKQAIGASPGVQRLARKRAELSSKFMESELFLDLASEAFDECDLDGSGTISAAEMYVGILVLYDQINRIPWGGRKPPPKREHVFKVLGKYDFNGSGELNREEFICLCQDLSANIVVDVSKRIWLILIIFPMLAMPIKRGLEALFKFVSYIPDHIFSSAMVALFAALLPYVEHVLQPTWTWESVEWEDGDAVRAFREQRRKLVEGSDKVRRRLAKEESERSLTGGKRGRATNTVVATPISVTSSGGGSSNNNSTSDGGSGSGGGGGASSNNKGAPNEA